MLVGNLRGFGLRTLMRCALAAATVVTTVHSTRAEEALNPADVEYFEKHIRPVLVSQCAECHSDSIQAKGGLRLDIAAGPKIGGQRGQTIIPGKPEESLLIKALKYDGLRMPPGGKLDDE
ncbi:MAG: hypothetical protein NT069_10050, partial [Planctomycetota bacterium]|nr:hypothetical protein [Planctomycetota bacterium]